MTELGVPQDCYNMSSGSRLSRSFIKKKQPNTPTLQHLHAKGCNTGFGRKRKNAPAWEKSSSKLASVLIYIFTPKRLQLSEAKAWLYGRSNNARWEAAQHQPSRALTDPRPRLPPSNHTSLCFFLQRLSISLLLCRPFINKCGVLGRVFFGLQSALQNRCILDSLPYLKILWSEKARRMKQYLVL